MVQINFPEIPDNQQYTPVPEGKYIVEVLRVDESTTDSGDLMWTLVFAITDGPHKNRQIRDRIFPVASNPKLLQRVKLICSRLGLDVSGAMDLEPDMLKGRKAVIETFIEERQYVDKYGVPKTGKDNKVPFAGYEAIGAATPYVASQPATAGAGATASPSRARAGAPGDNLSEENIPF